jgi:2-succinyl-5-enolpyruvyl-6-hydroxy-3-cyclohexene-1-carboxylate synthase
MYTIQENVRVVISLLKEYNIHYIVISPGGTNIPISQAVQDDSFFHCYSIPDERSAMYFAIGLHLQTGEIIATSCTSAQATRNYIPGLTEAFYKHTPILAITTAKLERFQYQDYMQAPDQCSLPKDSVKHSFDMPPITDNNTRIQCIQNAREAILEIIHNNPGPVQLNIRIIDTQQSKFENVILPELRPLKRYMAWDEWTDVDLRDKKILVIIGEHRPFTLKQNEAIEAFCKSYDTAVYVNHLSNYQGKYSIQGNLLVSCGGMEQLQPDVFITIGGQTGDYSIYDALNKLNNADHWRVCEDGNYVDTYGRLTKIFECPDYYFFNRMKNCEINEHSYYNAWKKLNSTMKYNIDLPFSNLYVAQHLYKYIPQNSIMNYAILNSLRCWNYFPLDPSIQCYGNVAAFGIDGCNSMLIGESMNTNELCFIITGDLAFFYDMNVLGIRHIKNNIRILLINNGGGAEFNIMTYSWNNNVHVENYISAKGHYGNARGWAENCGFEYLNASNEDIFAEIKNKFVSKNGKPILMEVFTKEENEPIALNKFISANAIYNIAGGTEAVIKKIVGKRVINNVKKFLGK